MDDNTLILTSTNSNLDPATAGAMIIVWLISMLVAVLLIVCLWKLFAKAGKPGWAAIIPIYNVIVMLEIVGRPIWWIALMFIPFVNFVIDIILILDFAKAYGKSAGYGVLMLFFPYIMYPVLAFSKDTHYVGPVAAGVAPQPSAPVQPQFAAQPQYTAPVAQPVAQPPVQPVAPEAPVTPPVNPDQPQQ